MSPGTHSCFTVLWAGFLTDPMRITVPTSGVAVVIDTGGTPPGKVMKMTGALGGTWVI